MSDGHANHVPIASLGPVLEIPIPNVEELRNTVAARRGRPLPGVWAIAYEHLHEAIALVATAEPRESIEAGPPVPRKSGSTAVIPIRGVLSKMGGYWSGDGSTIVAKSLVRAAVADRSVERIALHIESPGGSVMGLAALVDAVHEAAQTKPVVAVIEDLGASAAYEIASQANLVYANRGAYVGSIGAFTYVMDWSQLFSNHGVKVHVLSSGKFKGAGVPGSEVQPHHLEHWQHIVDEAHRDFVEAVARGRGMDPKAVAELADGRLFTAAESLAAGLIDGMKSLDEVLAMPIDGGTKGMSAREKDMTTENKVEAQPAATGTAAPVTQAETAKPEATQLIQATATPLKPQVATLAELDSQFPKASVEWKYGQLKAGATMDQAKDAYLAELERRIEAGPAKPNGNKAVGVEPPSRGEKSEAATTLRAAIDKRSREISASNPGLRPLEARAKALKQLKAEEPHLLEAAGA